MPRSGRADLPLHPGRAPRWLFERMVRLADAVCTLIVEEQGADELLHRVSDPFWFQALSCLLGFDWHSSGTTTVTCGALKEALDPERHGVCVAGGKGGVSRHTPMELDALAPRLGLDPIPLVKASRMTAKVDSALLQDGYELYHHVIFVAEGGLWAVVQQGMCDATGYARRYHWISEELRSFVEEPHAAILGEREAHVLDMTAVASEGARRASVDLVAEGPDRIASLLSHGTAQQTLDLYTGGIRTLRMPRGANWEALRLAHEFRPRNYEELAGLRGIGPATVRALALAADIAYGTEPSWRDPVRFSFAVGGKDGVPYPVNRRVMDETIDLLHRAVNEARVGSRERIEALQRLRRIVP
ncbi:MAG: DUF763 domain-containing protein [Candidatus Thermoplasmatota archaeon]